MIKMFQNIKNFGKISFLGLPMIVNVRIYVRTMFKDSLVPFMKGLVSTFQGLVWN